MTLQGIYYDGQSARAHAVAVELCDGHWQLHGLIERREPVGEVQISEWLGSVPQRLQFRDGAYCEVADHAGLAAVLSAAGRRDRSIEWLQNSRRVAIAAVLCLIVAALSAYLWGLPLVAKLGARMMPQRVVEQVSSTTLQLLDRQLLAPSELPAARRGRIEVAFARLADDDGSRLLFRSSAHIGPNALTLPDGRIVLLDELVAIAEDDEEILAVLAHELGHAHGRHGLELLIRGALLGFVSAWWLGDASALLAAAPVVLLQARHSRELERQADAYAVGRLAAVGVASARLADVLERIDAVERERNGGPSAASSAGYLDSHPATNDRIERLRADGSP